MKTKEQQEAQEKRIADREKTRTENMVWEWDGQKLKHGIPGDCLDILGEYAQIYSAAQLDGIGITDANKLRAEDLPLVESGAFFI